VTRLREWLADGPLITDGAWGTELQARGLEPGAAPDTWNLTHPDRVEAVARAYVQAGSQVILTNTFRANVIASGAGSQPAAASKAAYIAVNRAGVAISKRAAAGRALVFASIGPTGKLLATGEITEQETQAAFAVQSATLAAAGADALLIETMSDIQEARLAVAAAKNTGLPVIVSFAFDSGKNKDRTMTGATPEAVAAAMVEAGADAVGANCGVGIEHTAPTCRRLRAACDLPIWIKPNAGIPIMEETPDGAAIRYAMSADCFASYYAALLAAGASFIGGCCGSTPDFIRALINARANAKCA
jgi:5-methyltetrahydrofolate--homocysteine methyltransferase